MPSVKFLVAFFAPGPGGQAHLCGLLWKLDSSDQNWSAVGS